MRKLGLGGVLGGGFWLLFVVEILAQSGRTVTLGSKFQQLSDTTSWTQVAAIPLAFPAHHPQGMVKIGDYFYVSSVEVLNRTEEKGIGHLFKFDLNGKLITDLIIGEGTLYHPGGIDFDGQYIWVPVAEYRPNSRSVVYKVKPETLQIVEVFRFDDHLGGIVHDVEANSLHAVTWGSRTFYQWKLAGSGDHSSPVKNTKASRTANPSFYIDYQDCHYAGNHKMLCGGLKTYKNGSTSYTLGGLDLVDLTTYQPVHQVPITLRSPTGRPMTQNPYWLETTPTGLRAYFLPDDDKATLFIYEVMTTIE